MCTVTLPPASYHVGLVQGLFPVVQLLLKEAFLLTKQLLQQDKTCDAGHDLSFESKLIHFFHFQKDKLS